MMLDKVGQKDQRVNLVKSWELAGMTNISWSFFGYNYFWLNLFKQNFKCIFLTKYEHMVTAGSSTCEENIINLSQQTSNYDIQI